MISADCNLYVEVGPYKSEFSWDPREGGVNGDISMDTQLDTGPPVGKNAARALGVLVHIHTIHTIYVQNYFT